MSPERTAMSEKKNWRPMVEVGRDWAGISLVFATKEEAEANARWLMSPKSGSMRYEHIFCGWSKRLKPNESSRTFICSA
jgi:hypothetical protein